MTGAGLDDHVAALRELGDGDGEVVADTRARVRDSLARGRGAARPAGWLVAACVLAVGGVSWGFATGRLPEIWRGAPPVVEQAVPAPALPEPPPELPATRASVAVPAIAAAPAVATPPPPIADRAAVPAPSRYERAYQLYFHDRDYAAALAALDDYLAREPRGQFVVEARYNRALCLVHLDRLADAAAALAPFARGDVAPAGYRQREAEQLLEKIARRANAVNGAP
jgi:TolA-binding protein|nr:hypothetical protein [Kofleriaceae bacterium]